LCWRQAHCDRETKTHNDDEYDICR
jgi:hypothetical protein